MSERDARMALCCAVEPGNLELTRLVAQHGAESVIAALQAPDSKSRWSRRARSVDLVAVQRATKVNRLRFVVPGDDDWPDCLGDLAEVEPVQEMGGVPFGLWLKGEPNLATTCASSVAIVGSRAATAYGQSVATDLAAGLGLHRVSTVSGGAYGIDAAAHSGALATDAPTAAVMAGGLDSPYPPGNASLLQRVAGQGLLVSELPPGEHPTRARFLARNRLIAALSPVTVIVEAAWRSGARNTVSWAGALHRVVAAVPGPVHSATSVTPHRLIREAEAVLCTGPDDVLELLAPLGRAPVPRPDQRRRLDELSPDELAVYEALPARGRRDAGEVSLRAGVSLPGCLALLDRLAEQGLVAQVEGGWRLVRAEVGGRS
ncbi:DNA-processing protein DprA [Micropruina sonneratiae]|uniref:DNA-processing protein DprA n=1 Tax=Micropruina sonneratiae TaxID=2986940 RepID=UPI0022276CF2|nr:DNA-processing protein DprA [Micropruina sp. KQZ13P-5]MCW3157373.1 DNA-processing protein DprA [Micropruina sp. KQZ13P-5]